MIKGLTDGRILGMVKMKWTHAIFLVGAFFTVLSFQNCSAVHDENAELSSFEVCNLILKDEFTKDYHHWLVENCASCHVTGGTGNGAFADSDLDSAFDAFLVRGNELVGQRAINPSHQPPYTGSHNTEAINEMDEAWETAKVQADLCVASSGGNPNSDIEDGVVPEDETPTAGTILTYVKLLEADKDSKTLTWNLENEIRSPQGRSYAGATLSINVQAMTTVNGEKSYIFSNPKLKAGSQALHIQFIEFSVNNTIVEEATSFHSLNRRVPAGQERDLASSSTIFTYNVRSTDTIALSIGRLDVVEFDPPTFDQLIASNGVLGANCLSCHNGGSGNPEGGFDISSRQSVLNQLMVSPYSPNNSELFVRMNDTFRPMPQGGLLPQSEINQVLWWIQDGAP